MLKRCEIGNGLVVGQVMHGRHHGDKPLAQRADVRPRAGILSDKVARQPIEFLPARSHPFDKFLLPSAICLSADLDALYGAPTWMRDIDVEKLGTAQAVAQRVLRDGA